MDFEKKIECLKEAVQTWKNNNNKKKQTNKCLEQSISSRMIQGAQGSLARLHPISNL